MHTRGLRSEENHHHCKYPPASCSGVILHTLVVVRHLNEFLDGLGADVEEPARARHVVRLVEVLHALRCAKGGGGQQNVKRPHWESGVNRWRSKMNMNSPDTTRLARARSHQMPSSQPRARGRSLGHSLTAARALATPMASLFSCCTPVPQVATRQAKTRAMGASEAFSRANMIATAARGDNGQC
jgi:hypothetical protein